MNAVKYAFPSETSGTVMVTLKRGPGELHLTVADDGKGSILDAPIPGSAAGWSRPSPNSSVAQLERKSGNQGTVVRLTLPSPEASWRKAG